FIGEHSIYSLFENFTSLKHVSFNKCIIKNIHVSFHQNIESIVAMECNNLFDAHIDSCQNLSAVTIQRCALFENIKVMDSPCLTSFDFMNSTKFSNDSLEKIKQIAGVKINLDWGECK